MTKITTKLLIALLFPIAFNCTNESKTEVENPEVKEKTKPVFETLSIAEAKNVNGGITYNIVLLNIKPEPTSDYIDELEHFASGITTIDNGNSVNITVFDRKDIADKSANIDWAKDTAAVNSCIINFIFNSNGTIVIGNPKGGNKYRNFEKLSTI